MAQLGYRRRGRLLLPYIVAILICAIGGLAQEALQPLMAGRFPLAAPSIAVVIAAAAGGLGPGLLAVAVSTLIAAMLFARPFHYMLTDPNAVGLLLFVSLGLVVCLAISAFRQSRTQERNRRLEADQRAARLGDVEALATSVLKAQNSIEICRASLPHLIQTTDAAAGAIALMNDEEDRLEVMQSFGFSGAAVSASRSTVVPSSTLLVEALQRQKPVVFASQADRVRQYGQLGVDPLLVASESAMVLPLIVSGRAVGIVALSEPHPRMGLAAHRALLDAAVERIAYAVDRERRLARAERERADAEAYRAQADTELRERRKAEEAQRASEGRYRALVTRTRRLYALSAGLSEAATLDAVAKVIVREGKNVVGASAASVALVDGPHFETLYAEEYPRQIVESWHHFPAESGLCATAAVQTCQPVCVGSFDEWQRLYPRSATAAADGGYLSAAALPLLVDRTAIGVLSLHFTAPVNFDDEYRTLLTSVAQHAAQAIDRARAYESAQRARVESEAANRSKDDFLSIVSHELRTPLSAVLGWASMLRSRALDPARSARAVEAIYNNASRQTQLARHAQRRSRRNRARRRRSGAPDGRRARRRHPGRFASGRRCRDGGSAAARAGLRQPARQRREVHAGRRACHRQRRGGGRICRRPIRGHRTGDCARVPAAGVRAVPPGGGGGYTQRRRSRPGTLHRPAHRGRPWRVDSRRERRRRPRRDVHGVATGRLRSCHRAAVAARRCRHAQPTSRAARTDIARRRPRSDRRR
jgi:K+-sensing histidine kinase KdpD